jgi:hypothetical protein
VVEWSGTGAGEEMNLLRHREVSCSVTIAPTPTRCMLGYLDTSRSELMLGNQYSPQRGVRRHQ